MKRHALNRMFHALTPGPEREKALLEELLQNDIRRGTPVKNWKRIAVGVAVVALLMVCTVGAVAAVGSFFQTETIEVTKEPNGVFSLSRGEITYYPVDSLSDELKALEGPSSEYFTFNPERPTFDSWEKVEEFVGLELMNTPVLDASAAEIPYSELDNPYNIRRFAILVETGLREIGVYGDYQIGEVEIHVDQVMYTGRIGTTELEKSRNTRYYYDLSGDFKRGVEIEEETYVAPNGLEALIVKVDDEKGECLTTVSLNGIRTGITTVSPNGVKEARKVMIQVLDGFSP